MALGLSRTGLGPLSQFAGYFRTQFIEKDFEFRMGARQVVPQKVGFFGLLGRCPRRRFSGLGGQVLGQSACEGDWASSLTRASGSRAHRPDIRLGQEGRLASLWQAYGKLMASD